MRIIEAAAAHRKIAAIVLPNADERDESATLGVTWCIIGMDQGLMKAAVAKLM